MTIEQGQNPDGGLPDGDFMSEAKDWAGELISGQTGTGRILVSKKMPKSYEWGLGLKSLQAAPL